MHVYLVRKMRLYSCVRLFSPQNEIMFCACLFGPQNAIIFLCVFTQQISRRKMRLFFCVCLLNSLAAAKCLSCYINEKLPCYALYVITGKQNFLHA